MTAVVSRIRAVAGALVVIAWLLVSALRWRRRGLDDRETAPGRRPI